MRIGIDIDDTISDTYETIFAYAHSYTINKLGRRITPQIETISTHHYTKKVFGWNSDEENEFWESYFEQIIQRVKPYTLAVDTLKKLKQEKNEFVIITARYGENVLELSKQWLDKNGIEYDEIVVDAQNKATVALDKKIDLFIDDSFKNCTDVAKVGIKTYMMNTRTNKGLEAENITRVYSWPDIYEKIKNERR